MTVGGRQRLTTFAEHRESGQLVALTELFWDPKRATLLFQHATAVRPEHRRTRWVAGSRRPISTPPWPPIRRRALSAPEHGRQHGHAEDQPGNGFQGAHDPHRLATGAPPPCALIWRKRRVMRHDASALDPYPRLWQTFATDSLCRVFYRLQRDCCS